MELGWMRATGPDRPPLSWSAIRDAIAQSDALGLRQIHLPDLAFEMLDQLPKTGCVRLGVDVGALPPHPPRTLANNLHRILDKLDGRLVLGLSAEVSARARTANETIETLMSEAVARPLPTDFPMEAPRPEVLEVPQSGCSPNVHRSAANGFHALSPAWQSQAEIARHWPAIVAGATHATRRARPSQWHVARLIYVSDDAAAVSAFLNGPAAAYFGRTAQSKADPASLAVAGNASEVAAKLLHLRKRVGPFGVLQCIDPCLDADEGMRQRERLMTHVMPVLQGETPIFEKELERT